MPEREILKQAPEMLVNWTLAWIWGTANFLYKVYKGEAFRVGKMLLNFLLASFVWVTVISAVPHTFEYRDTVIFVSGFCALPILDFMEKDGWKYVINFFLRALKMPEISVGKK